MNKNEGRRREAEGRISYLVRSTGSGINVTRHCQMAIGRRCLICLMTSHPWKTSVDVIPDFTHSPGKVSEMSYFRQTVL